MSLIKCRECKKRISNAAITCPGCGAIQYGGVFFKVITAAVIITLLFILTKEWVKDYTKQQEEIKERAEYNKKLTQKISNRRLLLSKRENELCESWGLDPGCVDFSNKEIVSISIKNLCQSKGAKPECNWFFDVCAEEFTDNTLRNGITHERAIIIRDECIEEECNIYKEHSYDPALGSHTGAVRWKNRRCR